MPKKYVKVTWKSHVEKWKDCTRCPLHETRTSIVLARGVVPCDVMFIGEAPGKTEDDFGRPFVGPAGMLLDQMIEEALDPIWICAKCRYGREYVLFPTDRLPGECPNGHSDVHQSRLRLAFTNLVCCIPLGEDRKKVGEPEYEHIQECKPRLNEFLRLGNPRVVIAVGALAHGYLEVGMRDSARIPDKAHLAQITHPAAILRADIPIAQKSLMRQRVVVGIRRAVKEGLGL